MKKCLKIIYFILILASFILLFSNISYSTIASDEDVTQTDDYSYISGEWKIKYSYSNARVSYPLDSYIKDDFKNNIALENYPIYDFIENEDGTWSFTSRELWITDPNGNGNFRLSHAVNASTNDSSSMMQYFNEASPIEVEYFCFYNNANYKYGESVSLLKENSYTLYFPITIGLNDGPRSLYYEYYISYQLTYVGNDFMPEVNVENNQTFSENIIITATCGGRGLSEDSYVKRGTIYKYFFNENNASSKVYQNSLSITTWVNSSGKYEIVLYNKDKSKEKRITIFVDMTNPILNLNINDGSKTNSAVTFSASKGYEESTSTITSIIITDENGTQLYSQTNGDENSYTPINDGSYTIIVTQSNGKTTSKTFIYDHTAPTGTLSSQYIGPNQPGTFIFEYNASDKITVNGSTKKIFFIENEDGTDSNIAYIKITSGINGSDNIIKIEDEVGNYSTYNYIYDDINPAGTLDSIFCSPNLAANFSWTENNISLYILDSDKNTLKNLSPSSTKTLNVYTASLPAAEYYIRIMDRCGNYTDYNYSQEHSFSTEITQNVEYISDNENNCTSKFSWSNTTLYITATGKDIYNEEKILTKTVSAATNNSFSINGNDWGEGEVKVVFKSDYNLTKSFTVIVDKTNPTTNLVNNGYYKSFILNWNDLNFDYASVTINQNSPIKLTASDIGSYFDEEGKYVIYIYDKSQNVTKITCYVDHTPVEITSGQEDGKYYSTAQKVIVSDSNLPTETLSYYYFNDSTEKIAINYTSKILSNTFSLEGKYELHIFDLSSNETILTFFVDLHKATIVGIEDGAYYNQIPNVIWSDNYGISKVTLNGTEINSWSDYSFPTTSDCVSYTLIVSDLTGANTEITFIYDTIAANATLYKNEEHDSDEIFVNGTDTFKLICTENDILSIGFYDSTDTLKKELDLNKTANTGVILNPNDYEEGRHYYKVEDKAHNISYYYVNIDYTNADYKIYISGTETEKKQYYNSDISINWTELDAIAYLKINDGEFEEYKNNSPICTLDNSTVNFEFYIIDKAGNISDIYKFTIDKEIDYGNYNYLVKNNYNRINEWYNTFEYITSKDLNIGSYYSFSTKEQALLFASNRETAFSEKIKYSVLIENGYITTNFGIVNKCYPGDESLLSSLISNPDKEVYIYRNLSARNEVCYYISELSFEQAKQYFINDSITHYYRYFDSDSKIYTAYNDELFTQYFYINTTSISLNKKEEGTTIKYKKNSDTSYHPYISALTDEGTYFILEEDRAGNILEYVIVIDRTSNTYSVINQNGIDEINTTKLNNLNSFSINSDITLVPSENFVVTKLIKDGELVGYYNGSSINLNTTGIYEFYGYDASGNKSKSYTIYLNKEELNVYFEKEYDEDGKEVNLKLIIENYDLTSNDFLQFTVTKKIGDVIETLEYDSEGTYFKQKNKLYIFNQSAEYTCVIIDNYGNKINISAELALDKPSGTLYCDGKETQENNFITCKNVYLDWNPEKDYSAKLDGYSYSKNTPITTDGTHTLLLINGGDVDNARVYTFTIDKKKPQGYIVIDGVKNEGNSITTASTNVCFIWEDLEYITATLNGYPYESGGAITIEGSNSIILTSKSGMTNEYIIILDYTPPTVQIYAGSQIVPNGIITNKKISFVFGESKCTATVNGLPYVSGTYFRDQGTYTLLISDRYGNAAVYSATIDLSEPTIYAYNAETNERIPFDSKINFPFYLSWNDDSYKVYVDNVLYTAGTIISSEKNANSYKDEDKKYIIKAQNEAGTTVERAMYLSYLEPTFSLYAGTTQVFDGYYTNKSVYLKAGKFVDYILLNNTIYESEDKIYQENTHLFTIVGTYGTIVEISITIDKTNPILTIDGVEDGGYTNKNVTIYCEEEVTAKFSNGAIYEVGTPIIADNSYKITFTDKANNTTTISFTIKTTSPEYEISTEVFNGKYVNKDFSVKSNDTITCNGEAYKSGTVIRNENTYNFEIIDKAKNVVSFQIIYDKTPVEYSITGLNSNSMYTNQTVIINFEVDAKATLNGDEYISGTPIEEDGIYYFRCYDFSNNIVEFTFYISHEISEGTLYTKQGNIENNSKINTAVAFTWNDDSTVLCDGNQYKKDTFIKTDGLHLFVITNKFGNQKTYYVDIFTGIPEGELIGVNENGYTNQLVRFIYDELKYKATLNSFEYKSNTEIIEDSNYQIILSDFYGNQKIYNFIIKTSLPQFEIEGIDEGKCKTANNVYIRWNDPTIAKATLNGKDYTSGTRIYLENEYVFEIWDLAQNYTFLEFQISKELPQYQVEGFSKFKNKTNQNVTFIFESNCTATINGIPYYSGIEITESNDYLFVITSDLGISDSFSFTINKNSPDYILSTTSENGFINNITNGKVNITWTTKNCICYVNGKEYTMGRNISEESIYYVELYDELGNVSEFSFEIFLGKPQYKIYGLTNEEKMMTNQSFYVYFENNATAICNGEPYTKFQEINISGEYYFVITNIYGTSEAFTIIYDDICPEATIKFDEKASVIFDNENNIYYTNGKVNFAWNSKEILEITLNGESIIENEINLKSDNDYVIILTDYAYNRNVYMISIITSFDEPTLITSQIGGFRDSFKTNGIVTLISEKSGLDAKILSDNEENEYVFGTEIEKNGKYKIVVEDFLKNQCIYEFEINHDFPEAILVGVEDGGYTNRNVKITWEGNITGSYITNNDETTEEECISGKIFRNDAIYTVTITNDFGTSTTYTFEINTKEFDYGILTGIENNGYTNSSFSFSWEKDELVIEIIYPNGNIKTYGPYSVDDENKIKNLTFTENGLTVISITNKYNNQVTLFCTIDNILPRLTLSGVENGGKTNSKASCLIEEENIKSCVIYQYDLLTNELIKEKAYQSETNIYSNGLYKIICEDLSGNIVEVSFEIKEEDLSVFGKEIIIKGDNSFKINEFDSTKYKVYVNDELIEEQSIVFEEPNTYNILIKDDYGNYYETKIIIKEPIVKDYTLTNVLSIITVSIISITIIIVIVKKFKNGSKNIYQMK